MLCQRLGKRALCVAIKLENKRCRNLYSKLGNITASAHWRVMDWQNHSEYVVQS